MKHIKTIFSVMKKTIIFLLSAITLSIFSFSLRAQDRKMNVGDFEKRKQAYVKEKAALTDEEAQRYFPLNSELNQKKFELNRQYRQKLEKARKNNQKMSDEEYRQIIENDVELKMKEAELEKEYSAKFDKVLSPEKLFKAQQAEKTFIQQEVARFREQEKSKGKNK
jgi:Spy/CpxP family protein refolding chaperone